MARSPELRRIVGAMTERPWHVIQFSPHWARSFTDSYPAVVTDPGDDGKMIAGCDSLLRSHDNAAAITTLANHADALVALVEACEGVDAAYREDVPKLLEQMRKIRQALAAVHAIEIP